MADRLNISIFTVTHFRKETGGQVTRKAAHRVHGSIANVAAPRLNFGVMSDPDNPDRKLLLETKVNILAPQKGLAYSLAEKEVAPGISAPYLIWEDKPVEMTADQATADEAQGEERQTTRFVILDELKNAAPYGLPPAELIRRTGRTKTSVWNTLRRMAQKGEVLQQGFDYFLSDAGGGADVSAFGKD
jgi:hypothetical protein